MARSHLPMQKQQEKERITQFFKGGRQADEHPAPGRAARGAQRPWSITRSSLSTCWLLEVLVADKLLKIITATV
jgi:hypothetical protein